MMKILLYNIPDTLNYGSMMMAENVLYYMSRARPTRRVEFLVVTPKPEETSLRLRQALSGKATDLAITPISPGHVLLGSRVGKLISEVTGIGLIRRLPRVLRHVDAVIVLGGDDFTEDYGYVGLIRRLLRLRAFARAGVKVIMLGQSVGPFQSWREPVVRVLLQSIKSVVAREPDTFRYLVEHMRLRNVSLAADLAFLPLAAENEKDYPRILRPYWVIVPSEILWRYARTPDRQTYIQTLGRICRRLLEELTGYELLVLPHVVTGRANDDRLAARDLVALLEREGVASSRVRYIEDVLLPWQARRLLGDATFVVTGRMHAGISALTRGTPAVSLAYSRKYHGILKEYLGLFDWVLDVREHDWSAIEEDTVNAVVAITSNWERLRRPVADRVATMKQKALQAIEDVSDLLDPSGPRQSLRA